MSRVIAINKQVEAHTGRMIRKYVGGVKTANFSDSDKVKKFLLPIVAEKLTGYSSVHELRLINNAIKHESSKVTS